MTNITTILDNLLNCNITYSLFDNPVVIDDGYIYEKTSIEQWKKINNVSPLTRKRINGYVIKIPLIKNLINKLIKLKIYTSNQLFITDKSYKFNRNNIIKYIVNKKFDKLLLYHHFDFTDIIYDVNVENDYYDDMEFIDYIFSNCNNIKVLLHVIQNGDPKTSIYFIYYIAKYSKYFNTFKELVNNEYKITTDCYIQKNILQWAMEFCNIKLIDYLIDKGFHINDYDDIININYKQMTIDDFKIYIKIMNYNFNILVDNYHLLTYCFMKQSNEITRYVINNIVDINLNKHDIIQIFKYCDDLDLIKLLFENNNNLTIDLIDWTITHSVLMHSNNISIIKYIIDKYDNLDYANDWGWLPIHAACKYSYPEIIYYLITDKNCLVDIAIKKYDDDETKQYFPHQLIELNKNVDNESYKELYNLLLKKFGLLY